jgi:hypothetical protein
VNCQAAFGNGLNIDSQSSDADHRREGNEKVRCSRYLRLATNQANGEKPIMRAPRKFWILATVFMAGLASSPRVYSGLPKSGATVEAKDAPYVVEYYYKAKWGHAEEFLALFKKNHYPVLKKEMELGRILRVSMAAPRLHSTEDGRWDYRVTIVFKSAAIANDNFDSEALLRQLYPDQERYKEEEQRRFEILDGHWDLPIKDVALDKR